MKMIVTKFRNNRHGASAVEFAIVFPLFIITIMTMIGYGIYISAATSVQQISADAARASIAGLDPSERQRLAELFVASAVTDRAFIDPVKVTVTVTESPVVSGQISVQIDYDADSLPIWSLFSYALPLDHTISRISVVRIGGI